MKKIRAVVLACVLALHFFPMSAWIIEILRSILLSIPPLLCKPGMLQGELSFQTTVLIWISNYMDMFLLALSLTEGRFYKWKDQVKTATGFWIALLWLWGCAAPEASWVQSIPWVWNRVQGKDCPVAANVDTSQNCSPRGNFSSHHCSHTTQWLAHTARISDSRHLFHKKGCANRRNYFVSFLNAPSDTTLMARTVQHTLFMSAYLSGVWPSNCFSIIRLHGCTLCPARLRRNINL